MKKSLLVFAICMLAGFVRANNLQIGAVKISADKQHIEFTVKWDNSWKVNGGPANYDAVWVFIKYQDCATNNLPWQHVGLSTNSADHTVDGGVLTIDATADGKGVFIRRSAAGSGNLSSANVSLKMNINDNSFNYQVNGLEMVYVPQGPFFAGDGNRGGGNKWGFGAAGGDNYLQIDANVNTNGLNSADYVSNASWGSTAKLPGNSFPFGYNAYYMMKYEISQEAYANFLNTLTYDQQLGRFTNAPNSAPGTFAIAGLSNPQNGRNGIRIKSSGQVSNVPATVGCDLNLNGVFDEADDGQNIACNWLSWGDMIAFLDWAALRPMTEFEYEKACRGASIPAVGEYAWGSNTILAANSGAIVYPGAANEVSISVGAGLCAYGVNNNNNRGPLRCGFAATSTSNRTVAGASFYGIMELTGNVNEQCLGGYNYNYSAFTSVSGDGDLTVNGSANTANWPANGGGQAGGIARGGNWFDGGNILMVSNRDWMTSNFNQNRDVRNGGRGVRMP